MLRTIEVYRVSSSRVEEKRVVEPYDEFMQRKLAVPPTKVDTLVVDLWVIMSQNLHIKEVSKRYAPLSAVEKAIDVFASKQWSDINGCYRPWTHSHFIKGMTDAQRKELAVEVVNYIKEFGVWDAVVHR
jgi:hypothetical protein